MRGTVDRIRLAPHLTVLRRDDHDLQLGFDVDDAVVLADPDGSLATVLGLMDGRYRLPELQTVAQHHGVEPERLDHLLTTLASSGLLEPPPSRGPAAASVRLIGSGDVVAAIGDQLLRAGVGRLLVVDPDAPTWTESGPRRVRLDHRQRVQRFEHWSQPELDAADLTVVASSCLEPDRALAAELTQADHPHLWVRPRTRGAVLGPFVLPGRTSCLRCGDLRRTRTDSAWPRMLAQLCRTRGRWDPLAVDWTAALVTTQVLGHLAGRTIETAAATVELGPLDWSWQRRVWPADPACGCCWDPRAEW